MKILCPRVMNAPKTTMCITTLRNQCTKMFYFEVFWVFGQGFGGNGAAGVASVRRWQKLVPFLMEPIPWAPGQGIPPAPRQGWAQQQHQQGFGNKRVKKGGESRGESHTGAGDVAKGGCDPVGSPAWSRITAGPWIEETRFAGGICDPPGNPGWSSPFLKEHSILQDFTPPSPVGVGGFSHFPSAKLPLSPEIPKTRSSDSFQRK